MLLLGGSLSLCAQSKYPPIEELVYTGYYNWGFIWFKSGRGYFSVTTSEKYPNAERLKAVGYSLPSWDWIFTIRDTLISHFDKNTFMPYEFSRKAHEGNYHKTFDYTFHYDDSVVLGDIHRIARKVAVVGRSHPFFGEVIHFVFVVGSLVARSALMSDASHYIPTVVPVSKRIISDGVSEFYGFVRFGF